MTHRATPRSFRVEHRTIDGIRVLAQTTDVYPHHDTLTPYVTRLLTEHATGEVVLVDQETNADVARRHLSHGIHPRRRSPSQKDH